MLIVTTDTLGGGRDEHYHVAGLITATAVTGANVVRDFREAITNTFGGHMTRYEEVIDQTMTRALGLLEAKARSAGYDAVVGLRISHPVITDGAIEIIVAGTGLIRRD
ncbi:MAG: heavy metal-binding domain-containing protein [Pseudomonadota bacterium]